MVAYNACMKERIQKLLAHAGYGSRREIERWIEAGEIKVNGQTATIGQPIDAHDQIAIRGKRVHLSTRLRATSKVIMYNKRVGEMCTRNDPEGRNTVFESLPRLSSGRWVMIGRLDVNTDGLILFTTDGALANKLMHPSSEVEREYACRILGNVEDDMLKRLQTGVELDDGMASFLRIRDAGGEGANHWYHVVLAEGRNREVRRLWESQEGLQVSRLHRVRYGNIALPRYLRPGYHEELDAKTLRKLYESVGMTYEGGDTQQEQRDQQRMNKRPQSRTERRATRPTTDKGGKAKKGGSKMNPYAGFKRKR